MRAAAAVLALTLTACASMAPPAARTEPPVLAERLFCGLSIPGGGTVTQQDLDTFIAEVVEPRFPQGFTTWRAQGRWKGGVEETMVIEIIHPLDAKLGDAVGEIATEYRRRFKQEAVMRVMIPARMEFETED